IQPFPVFLPFNILEDFTRPFSLMLRLYANILVGELLAGIMLGAAPYVAPSMVICLELFVAIIQAYIFALLSSVYIALLSAEDH
ncbi:MAG: F0F1 ATP synthase subunit A, partial [Cyanobacteria bacterium HKST-UBA05]|nr:F0F1 ATP synthase subunit A [Cyanobacteria bacterium HKST-UBA05]